MRCKYKTINNNGRTVREHTLIVETILKRQLKDKERIHHMDYDKSNNDNTNLVVCPNDAYHFLLHRRTDAFNITGNPDKLKCQYCGIFDNPENITIAGSKRYHRYHKECKNKYLKKYRSINGGVS